MTTIQATALVLYSAGAVFAVAGPLIAAIRVFGKYRAAREYEGTWDDFDKSFSPRSVQGSALRDAVWGLVEFGFVALGVVLASVASIVLVVPS